MVDFTDFEEEMPAQAIQAMKDNQGNSEFAYTATGEILDLSSLQGYLLGGEGEDDNDDGMSMKIANFRFISANYFSRKPTSHSSNHWNAGRGAIILFP